MCYDECCEMCKPGDSQTCTPGANNTLYVNKKIKNSKKSSEPIHLKAESLYF